MVIFLALIAASFLGSVAIVLRLPIRDNRFGEPTISKSECFKRWVALILCLIVFAGSFLSLGLINQNAIGDAKAVAYVKKNDNEKLTDDNTLPIYFDSETNTYFVLEFNVLNPFKPFKRVELAFDKTEKYIEVYNQLVELNPYN